MNGTLRASALAAAAFLSLPAASPSPAPTPVRINVLKLQSPKLLPTVPLHTEFVVEVNKLGQVTRIVHGSLSKSGTYNTQTYGNALQAFIRTPDGNAISGTYKLTYDFSPKTGRVRRDVALVKAGGVNPDAPGAAATMTEHAAKRTPPPAPRVTAAPAPPTPRPTGTMNSRAMPDLPQVMKTP